MSVPILVDDRDGVRIATINRPDRRNALDVPTITALGEAVTTASADGLRAVVLTGADGHFSAGGDAGAISGILDAPEPIDTVAFMRAFHRTVDAVWECELPVIAAVEGVAYGGGFNLALACDLIVASTDARFCQVFLRRDVVPDVGGAYLLPRLVGLHRAKDLMLRPRPVSAAEALAMGFVAETVDGPVLDRAVEVARETVQASRSAVALTKQLVNASTTGTLAESLQLEAFTQSLALRTENARAGFAPFVSRGDTVTS